MTVLLHLRRLWHRDRRRIAFSASLVAIATVLALGRVPSPVSWIPGEVFAIAIVLVVTTSIAYFAPKYRFLYEVFAIAAVIFHGLGLWLPGSNFNVGNPDGHMVSFFILFFATMGAVHFATYGRWLDRVLRPRRTVYVARARSTASVRSLWYGLMPTPGHLEACPDPDVVSIDYADPDHKSIRLITWLPGRSMGETQLHIKAMEPLKSVTVEIEIKAGRRDLLMPGITTYEITDMGSYRAVYVRHEMTGLAMRIAIRGWLDDTLGRFVDIRLRAVERSQALRAKGGRAYGRHTYEYDQLRATKPVQSRRTPVRSAVAETLPNPSPNAAARLNAGLIEARRHAG